MPFIKTQNLKYSPDGEILTGSASIVDVEYVPGAKNHSRQLLRERLGKVLWYSKEDRKGVFLSPERGLVEYSATLDQFSDVDADDPRLPQHFSAPDPLVHSVFGDAFLTLSFLEKSPLLPALQSAFPQKQDLQRVLAHILHSVIKDGSHIHCDDFIGRSFASYLFDDLPLYTLKSDTAYFRLMGEDATRLAFFKSYVETMRRVYPGFGKGCYVDSTPLPNDISDNPFNALCCHGVNSSTNQTRLVLVLDEETSLPVWYTIIPGNVLDLNTITTVMEDVKVSLDIEISSMVLDAGYASKELLQAYHIGSEKKITVRCPMKRGYGTDTVYREVKNMIHKGKYEFVRDRHLYFGHRLKRQVFGQDIFYYVYVDQNNAMQRHRDNLMKDPERFENMTDKEKDYETIKGGYFILLSNEEMTPAQLLDNYFNRVEIEMTFRTAKGFLGLLPLSKWTDQTVRGKILSDIISLIVYTEFRKQVTATGNSMTSVFGKASSLMCFQDRRGTINVETPNRQVKEIAKALNITIPATLKTSSFQRKLLGNM